MKRTIAVLALAALLLGCLAGCGTEDGETVSVQKVSLILGQGNVGLADRYAGLVVSGQTAEVKRDTTKKILEVYVEAGDWVNAGDILFAYDTEAMQLELDKLYLELEGYENTILSAQDEIPRLEALRDSAGEAQKLSYTLQIQTLQADVREAEYNKALKEREAASLEESMEDTEIPSPLTGRVMSVTENGNSNEYASSSGSGDSTNNNMSTYITVMDMTTFQVKGTINELNVGSLAEGMNVIIRSRLDENVTWKGTVDRIDWENRVENNNNNMYYYGSTDEMTSISKYPFYINLEDITGLILGQHVYIEPDYGQEEEREGLWLPSYYINDVSGSPWVWAASRRDRLEKRTVTLGEYDMDSDSYQILSGLTMDDSIAFPMEGLEPGMAVTYYDENNFGGMTGGMTGGMGGSGTVEVLPEEDGAMEALPEEGPEVATGAGEEDEPVTEAAATPAGDGAGEGEA